MIGILIITHGSFGEALLHNACQVLNRQPAQIAQLGLEPDDDPLDLLPRARQLRDALDSGEGVLILTDIFGATPANLALKLLAPGHTEGLTGVNLPMLLRALTYQDRDLATLVVRARDGGRDGILDMLHH